MGGDDHSKCYTLVILLIAFTCIVLGLDVLIAGRSVGAALICVLTPIILLAGAVPFILVMDTASDCLSCILKRVKNFLTKRK
jgi:hypothetical protein